MIGRWLLIAMIGLGGIAWGGCYASTEPATDVGQSSARLHAHGTANNGEATSYFELWPTGSPSRQVSTGQGFHWPAGASGPFSRTVEGLYPSTPYSFRVCGRDDSGGSAVCAQTRTFTTAAATQDEVWGGWFSGPGFNGYARARSGPSGESPSGSLFSSTFIGFVTCLAVDGNRVAVGAVGEGSSMLLTVVDGGPTGNDSAAIWTAPVAIRPNCGSASFANQMPIGPDEGGFVVIDAP